MLPQNLDSLEEISDIQLSNNSKPYMKPETASRIASKCSCSQCNSIDCFEIRNQNSGLLCTCSDCKDGETCTFCNNNLSNQISKNDHKEHDLKDLFNQRTNSDKSKVDLKEHIEYSYKDITLITDKVRKREKSHKKSYTRNYSVALNYSQNEEKTEHENPTNALSAQVMNLPYEKFKNSLSVHKKAPSLTSNNVTKSDILTKLKEIYKACSCKVCECITGKPCFSNNIAYKNDTCDCENNNSTTQLDFNRLPHSGCPCVSCDRKDCQGVVKKTMAVTSCDCKTCDCVKFTESLTKPCKCEPCQCAECTSLNLHLPRSITIAPVHSNFYQNVCQCAPCECVQCTQNYGAMATSSMREISTEMVTHRNCECRACLNNACQLESVNCRCADRTMKKPIDRNNRNYDLYRALVGENTFSPKLSSKIKNNDTIAMFALSSNYSNFVFNKSTDRCQYKEYECIVDRDKEKSGSKIKNSYELDEFANVSNNTFSACKCQSCECQVCCKVKEAQSSILEAGVENRCGCNICGCIICSENNRINNHSKTGFKNELIENCKNISRELFYPLKKGQLLTKAMFEAKMLSHSQPKKSQPQLNLNPLKKCLPDKSILEVNGNKSNKKKLGPLKTTIGHTGSLHKYFDTVFKQSSSEKLYQSILTSNHLNIPKTIDINDLSSKHDLLDIKKNIEACEYIDTNKQNSDNLASSDKCQKKEKNLTLVMKSSVCDDEVTNKEISYREANNGIKLLNNYENSKVEENSKKDFFCSKIVSFEKSIAQLMEEISQHRKTLSEIRSKGIMFYHGSKAELSVCHNNFTESLRTTNMVDSAKPIKFQFCENTDKTSSPENKKIEKNLNNSEIDVLLNSYDDKIDQIHNLSNDDNKMYRKLINRTRTNKHRMKKIVAGSSKTNKSFKKSENKNNVFINDDPKENCRYHNKNKLTSNSLSLSYESCLEQDFENKIQDSLMAIDQLSDKKEWSVLKKNLYISHLPMKQDKGICTISELDLNFKHIVKSVSLQTAESREYVAMNKLDVELKYISSDASSQTKKRTLTVEKEVNCNIDQLIEELNEDVKHLLDLLLLQTVCKSELTRIRPNTTPEVFRMPKMNSVKSSCDDLRVSFVGLKKVSDHTVLVKWKMPREAEKIQGYELQVDGRPVQKILSPTRCVAVPTDLFTTL